MMRLIAATLTSFAIALPCAFSEDDTTTEPNLIEIAICLDTSNSMDGLIDSARQTLWSIVNDLALAKPTPKLRVALLAFGSPAYGDSDGWVVVQSPLTEDLDVISERLFAITTDGGTELVGRVLGRANDDLDWSSDPENLRLVIVAGNESADQDQVRRFQEVCKTLIERNIMVNAIYCGNPDDEIAPGWRSVAALADGHFASIDQDNGVIAIATPFDEALVELSAALNTTYLAYGTLGAAAASNQIEQDENAAKLSQTVAADRCATKASAIYACGTWDLVDASAGENFDITTLKVEQLPEAMRGMTKEEKLAHIKAMGEQRAAIQTRISAIMLKRTEFITIERAKLTGEDQSLDGALRAAIRLQAISRGFVFPAPPEIASAETVTDKVTP